MSHSSKNSAVLALAMLAGVAPVLDAQTVGSAGTSTPGWAARYGMVLPRPADAEQRLALGYPAPRDPDAILAELDALTAEMKPIAEQNDVWKQRFREYRAMQQRRISLASELEEASYDGARLGDLLATKLDDITAVWPLDGPAATSYQRLRREVERRHPGSKAAIEARADALMDYVHVIVHADLRVHPGDYPKLAEVELQRKDGDEAGILILEALVGERRLGEAGDQELVTEWKDWIVANLGPRSLGYRHVMRERMFGSPIRLRGATFSGEAIDTGDWLGDVVLVDFWGTWCVPCREAMPHLQEMQRKYGDRGLRVVGVLCDPETEKAERYVKEHGYDWPQLVERGLTAERMLHPIAEKYAIGAFPTLWIIDRKGILREDVDRDELEDTVLRYLAESR